MKFKENQQVKIKTDLQSLVEYNGCIFASDMRKYLGKKTTIKRAGSTRHGDRYKLFIDGGDWSWSNDMLEPVNSSLKSLLGE